MEQKEFKAESKRLLDLMINSIYTHKEIFLRELISNASDAIDKLYYRALTENITGLSRDDFEIRLDVDRDARTITLTDNGCGMTREELEQNLGTIAKSGSLDFKDANAQKDGIDIIGQFGVGFYSAFMVASKVTVYSRAYSADQAWVWESTGADGYTIDTCDKPDHGTKIVLTIKEDTDDEQYSEYLSKDRLQAIVKKYSDYIRYPIRMEVETQRPKADNDKETETVTELKTLNSMVPLWRKNRSEIKPEEYNQFYKEKFYDFEDPLRVIHSATEGTATYNALLFIPARPAYGYYTTEFQKGLQLYANGVLIMDKCADLLPDYFSFVRGLVDSEDLSLNISREMLQHDRQLQLIERALERRIKGELEKLLENDREKYEALWKEFGTQLTYGLCMDYGMHKDTLQDLQLFYSSTEKKLTTLKEYVGRMKEGQEAIYYGCGRTVEAIDALPQADQIKEAGYEMLYMTGQVDEFAIKTLREYDGKKFLNIRTDEIDLSTEEQKKALAEENEAAADLFAAMKEALGEKVHAVRFTDKLKSHPVCLSTEGGLSMEMEQTLNAMPGRENRFKADVVLELNPDHPVTAKLKEYAVTDKEKLSDYAKLLYAEGCLIGGVPIEEPAELCRLITGLMEQ